MTRYGLDGTGYLFAYSQSFLYEYIYMKEREAKRREGMGKGVVRYGIFHYSLVFFSYSLFGWMGWGAKSER